MSLYQLKNISFDYGAGFSLTDINIEIEPSSITAVVGPNGSGKTSLLNILSFLHTPGSGTLKYKETVLNDTNLKQCRKTIGYVQQKPYLLRGTVFNNIELGLKLKQVDKVTRTEKVLEVMQVLGITALSNRIARTLSGGEAQKVAVAQMLVLEPEVLILDEPFTHLDKKAITELETLILKLKKDFSKTVVFTTHDQYQAQWLADTVFSVIEGKVFRSQIMNLFSGSVDLEKLLFNTGMLSFNLPEGISQAEHIAIDPKQIVLSRQRLDSSMQNSFSGKVVSLTQTNGQIKISVDAGETFHAIVTHKALDTLALSLDTEVWVSFKSSSIVVF